MSLVSEVRHSVNSIKKTEKRLELFHYKLSEIEAREKSYLTVIN
jgi:hypothetical protein